MNFLRLGHHTPYQEYMKLLVQLQTLIDHNMDESDEGEALRTKMDKLWVEIPEDKRREINRGVRLPDLHG